jgi:hypothetical protein
VEKISNLLPNPPSLHQSTSLRIQILRYDGVPAKSPVLELPLKPTMATGVFF